MNHLKYLAGIWIYFFCQITGLAQMSGYYSIGGPGANYASLDDALCELYAQGISDKVVFGLNPGNYSGVAFTAIPGTTAAHTFEMRSATLDSNDVIIDGTISLNNCSYVIFRALTVIGNQQVAFQSQFSNGIKLYYNSFRGGIDMEVYNQLVVKGNYVNGEIDFGLADSLVDNKFESNNEINISAKYLMNNKFLSPYFSTSNPSYTGNTKYIGNFFQGDINHPHATNIFMSGNTFSGDVYLSFNQVLHFNNNLIYGDLNYGDPYLGYWNYLIQNNIFIGGCLVGRGSHSKISYNNFIDGAYLWYEEFYELEVHDNNFCTGISGVSNPSNVSNNNYFPLTYKCYNDSNPLSYDPKYDFNKPGIATNPLLQGKGVSTAPELDFTGKQRKNPPAVGANEISICTDSSNNILSVPCGEQLFLNLCSLPESGSWWWQPDTCIIYPDSSYTSITACCNNTWYLYNSVYGLVDSVILQVNPFQVEIAEMPSFRCGWALPLNATYHPAASYHWTPENGLSDPNIRNPLLYIDDTTHLQYILSCDLEGCGISYDTLNIEFDTRPWVNMWAPEQYHDTVYFATYSTCVDTYYWDFGDGSFSTEENPMHIFEEPGYYEVLHKGSSAYGSDSVSYMFYFFWVSLPENQTKDQITVFPDPVTEVLNIKGLAMGMTSVLSIINLQGRELHCSSTNKGEHHIDMTNYSNGIYILRIRNQNGITKRKIIVLH